MARKKLQKKRGDTIKLIVKSNELVDARYMFDAWETRFFHALVAMINKNDDDDKTYRIWFKDVKKLFNLKSNQSYSLLREAARSLNRKPVYIGWMNDQFRSSLDILLMIYGILNDCNLIVCGFMNCSNSMSIKGLEN